MTTIASLATGTTRGAVCDPTAGRAARSRPSASLALRPTSRSSRAISARTRDRRGARLSATAGGGDRVSAGDMKRALVNAGVDTSSCFERADLEEKFALLTDAQKANTRANAGSPGANASSSGASSARDASSEASASSSSTSSKEKDASHGASSDASKKKRGGETRGDGRAGGFDGAAMFDAALNAARETANRLEVRWGLGAKIKEQTEGLRQTVMNLDGRLGISKFFKNTAPPLWAKMQAFRQTPVGRVANFAFYVWLFLSGAFWTLLSFGLTAVFLVNLLFPQFFAQRAQKMQEQARERFAQQQGGMGGMPGGMGGMGGMGGPGVGGFGGPPPGGMGGMGGPPPGFRQPSSQGERKTYGNGKDGGSVVDIDADIKDV